MIRKLDDVAREAIPWPFIPIPGLYGPELERVVVDVLPDANFDPTTLSSEPPSHGECGFTTRVEWREQSSLLPGDE
jgi:hypothetical protein